ncbi:DUF2066 domain-containing protein [Sulfuriflexus sp.]|uniref:DUF2066 domain-containing protein n=1 Tax=Sulfuriflexus sp. TaxID=2015443 RepID=UPI0028CE9E44|nr:DUF2066 domain-containing protein [Sulfuriflexus sp.]MDT8404644.1 DUF2066 domain-containing protein [Sulfuriflexus sp.]
MRALILLLIFGFCSLPVRAAEVTDLYEAEVAVSGQGRTERHQAIRAALAEVLVKVSGNEQVALLPGIPQLLGESLQFLQQYRYRTTAATGETAPAEPQQWLWLHFNQGGLDKALRKLNVPIWGRTRPSTLLWLAVEKQGERHLLGSSDESALLAGISSLAKRRGIPLVLPLLDLEDKQHIKATDVWINFEDNIRKASARYDNEAILVGRLLELGKGRWQGRWNLNLDGKLYEWSHSGELETILAHGIEGTASTLAARYVYVSTGKPGELGVLVKGIRNLADFARSERTLRELNGVTDVHARQVDDDQVLFAIKTRADRQALLEAVRLSRRPIFTPVKNDSVALAPGKTGLPVPPQSEQVADIVFQLSP